jgi:hypothetical protein
MTNVEQMDQVENNETIGKLVDQAEKNLAEIQSFAIVSTESFEFAGEKLKKIKSLQKSLTDERMAQTRPIDEAKKRIIAWFDRPLLFLEKCESMLKSKMIGYQTEQNRIARERQEKLDAEAAKERARLEERADKAEANGKDEKAESLREKASMVAAPVIAPQTVKVAGIKTMKVWKAKVDAVEKISREHVNAFFADPKNKERLESYFSQIAKATKGAIKIEGVTFYAEEVIAAGRGEA